MRTDEDEGGVEVFVVLFRIVSVKLFGFSAIHGEEVVSGIVGSERFKELLEGGMEASWLECQRICISSYLTTTVEWVFRTTWDRFERPPAPVAEVLFLQARASPSVVIVAGWGVWRLIS